MSQLRKIKKQIQQNDEERISQIVTEFGADFLATSKEGENKQPYLNCVCTAWNLSLFPDNEIEGKLDLILEDYCHNNPETKNSDSYRHNLTQLIQRKRKLYPHIQHSIVDASILEQDQDIWIKVLSKPFTRKVSSPK
jgi:hypothetical protein